jgi:NhaA family Na+:H+ antiporter
MNRLGVTRTSSYILLGIVLWVAVLKSGVHATLAGILIAFCIPMRDAEGGSPLTTLEHNLHGTVAFGVLPIFAFANAGLSLAGVSLGDITEPVTLGVILGLLVGKPLGIMLFVAAAVGIGLAALPRGVNWPQLIGVALTCGIGFTMSLFIAGLAFENSGGENFSGDRLGILIGSLLSAIAAGGLLKFALPAAANVAADAPES